MYPTHRGYRPVIRHVILMDVFNGFIIKYFFIHCHNLKVLHLIDKIQIYLTRPNAILLLIIHQVCLGFVGYYILHTVGRFILVQGGGHMGLVQVYLPSSHYPT